MFLYNSLLGLVWVTPLRKQFLEKRYQWNSSTFSVHCMVNTNAVWFQWLLLIAVLSQNLVIKTYLIKTFLNIRYCGGDRLEIISKPLGLLIQSAICGFLITHYSIEDLFCIFLDIFIHGVVYIDSTPLSYEITDTRNILLAVEWLSINYSCCLRVLLDHGIKFFSVVQSEKLDQEVTRADFLCLSIAETE